MGLNQSSALTEADNPELGTCDGVKPVICTDRNGITPSPVLKNGNNGASCKIIHGLFLRKMKFSFSLLLMVSRKQAGLSVTISA
jgi:hypothetical protein